MITVSCTICQQRFVTSRPSGVENIVPIKIMPWNCPHCNNDSGTRVQRDLNELFKLIGFEAVERLEDRQHKLLTLAQMHLAKDQGPVEACLG